MTPMAKNSLIIIDKWVLVVIVLVVIPPTRTMALTPTEQRKQAYIDEVSKSYRPTVSSNNQSASLRNLYRVVLIDKAIQSFFSLPGRSHSGPLPFLCGPRRAETN
jgi:hypothetical protein